MADDPEDTTYRVRLDELLHRYGRKSKTPGQAQRSPLSYSDIGAKEKTKGNWKKQTKANTRTAQTAGPTRSSAHPNLSTTSPFAEAAQAQLKKRPLTAGISDRSQLNPSISHVTPDIERYYEYHQELYDFTFGAERETARASLETGWKQTNTPAAFQIPTYDARLDPHCPAAWRAGDPRPTSSSAGKHSRPRTAIKPHLRKGVSTSSPKTLRRSPEKAQSKRAVYSNTDMMSHPSIRDYKTIPLELPQPTELISSGSRPSKRKMKSLRKHCAGVSLLDSAEGDSCNPQQFMRLQDKIESLWAELCLPQYECEYYADSFLSEPTAECLQQAEEHLVVLQRHRSRTLEVLRHIQLRESVLDELTALSRSQNVSDMALLIKLVPALREHTVAAVEAVDVWREGMWKPMPFKWNGVNYLIKASKDLEPFFSMPWALKVPANAALVAVRKRHPGLGAIMFLTAERPDKLIPAAHIKQLQDVECSILQEGQLQDQVETHASQLLARGFLAPTLKSADDFQGGVSDDQLSPAPTKKVSYVPKPAKKQLQPEPQEAAAAAKFRPVSLDITSPVASCRPLSNSRPLGSPVVGSPLGLRAAGSSTSPFRSPTKKPAGLLLDLQLVRAEASDIIAQVDSRALRPKFSVESPSGLQEASLSLNLSSVMDDRASLLGLSKPPHQVADAEEMSSTEDADNTDIDSDYDDEVADIMGAHTEFKSVPGRTSPDNVPELNFDQLGPQMTDSSGGSYSEADNSYYGHESDQYYAQDSDQYSDSFYGTPPKSALYPGGSRTP